MRAQELFDDPAGRATSRFDASDDPALSGDDVALPLVLDGIENFGEMPCGFRS